MIQTTIDSRAGFCFGVDMAIQKAEEAIENGETLYCLGEIVHNAAEVKRLENKGMVTINREQFRQLQNATVLVRAHGEPPETYDISRQNNLKLLDATCPVVLKLQRQVAHSFRKYPGSQIVFFGKPGHAEVIGLNGQVNDQAIVVNNENDLSKIDYSRPVIMYSQTTRSIKEFHRLADIIRKRLSQDHPRGEQALEVHDTICREVAHRDEEIQNFAQKYDKILFISGKNSSNGKMLYEACRQANSKTYFISRPNELQAEWFRPGDTVGITGATSTPRWMMEAAAERVSEYAGG